MWQYMHVARISDGIGGCSAGQSNTREKKSGKSEMRRMQDDHSYLALYRDTAVVYAPRRSPIPGEKVRTEARE